MLLSKPMGYTCLYLSWIFVANIRNRLGEKGVKFERKIAILLLCLICGLFNVPVTLSGSVGPETSEIAFVTSVPAPVLSKELDYDVIRIPDFGVTTDVGKPMLPVKILPVLVPPDAEVQTIEVTSFKKEDLAGTYMVSPARSPVAAVASELPEFVEPDPEVYGSNEPYPGILFEDAGIQWFQGYKILNVRMFPVQYTPKDGRVTCYRSMRFRVTYASTGEAPSRGETDASTKEAVSTMVVNPEKVDEWVAESIIIKFPVPYIIITSPALESTFQRLADWKDHRGMGGLLGVPVYDTTWIYINYPGADNAEKIRNFIRHMRVNYQTSYVLLAGDYDVVPTRYMYMEDCLNTVTFPDEPGGGLTAHYKPTDYYYACLDGDWDPDGDGKYLEQIDTNLDGKPETCVEPIPDFYPEVYVGRIPVKYTYQANIVIDKIIGYERNPPPGSWRRKAVLTGAIANYYYENYRTIGGTPIPKTDAAKECKYVKDDFLTPKGYYTVTMYEREGLSPSTYSSTYPLAIEEVDKQVSAGCLILGTSGHGSPQEQVRKIYMWDDGDGVAEGDEMYWTPFIDTAMTLNNGENLPLVYMSACLNGKFDDDRDSVAEWLLKMEEGGGIGVTAASRISYYYIGWDKGDGANQELFYLFWEEFFDKTNIRRSGRMLYASKYSYYLEAFDMDLYYHKKNILIYNLIGDPETIIPAQDFIDSKPLAWPTSMDGHWSYSEWGDSEEIYVSSGTSVEFSYYLNVKNDGDWLYIVVDAVGDRTYNASDYCLIAFDAWNDGIFTVGSEDGIIIFGDGTVHHILYTGFNWADVHCSSTSGVPFTDHGRDEAGMIGAVDFYGGRQIYEFKIPLLLGDLNMYPGAWKRLDMELHDADKGYTYWPADCSWPNAETWGYLHLAYPYDLADYPGPFVHRKGCAYLGNLDTTFVVGGTHPHGPFNWGAWTVDVLGGIAVTSRLGNEATGSVNVNQAVDDDIADYNAATGSVTIQWHKITTKTLVSIGSGAVNLISLYYNDTIPYKFVRNSTGVYIYSDLSGKSYDYGWGYDHAVIALVYEPEIGYVLLTFGITGKGSHAASLILQHYDAYPELLTGKGVIVKWQDLNGDNIPDIYDQFSLVESYS